MKVYFIREKANHRFTSFCKIGMTTRDLRIRLEELQCGNPRQLVIVHAIDTEEKAMCKAIEANLHSEFQAARISFSRTKWYRAKERETEWFDLDKSPTLKSILKGKKGILG